MEARVIMDGAQVSIIIVSHNTRALLMECLDSVAASTKDIDARVVVVDNASTDGSCEAATCHSSRPTVVGNPTNTGFGAACNQAIGMSDSEFVLLLNSDARITQAVVQVLLACLRSDGLRAAAGCALVDSSGNEAVNTRNFLSPANQALEYLGIRAPGSRYLCRTYKPRPDRDLIDCSVDWIDGACMMIRRAALDDVGPFDERFFMYSEDEDLCYRLRKKGWYICFS
jgi:GT2 family glycosyltransferase